MLVKSQTSSYYLRERHKIQKPNSRAVSKHDVTVSSIKTLPGLHQFKHVYTSTKHHSFSLHSKDASSGFLLSTAPPSLPAGNDCYSRVTNIINKKTFFFPTTFFVVWRHSLKGYNYSHTHTNPLYRAAKTKKKYWDFNSFSYCLLQGMT